MDGSPVFVIHQVSSQALQIIAITKQNKHAMAKPIKRFLYSTNALIRKSLHNSITTATKNAIIRKVNDDLLQKTDALISDDFQLLVRTAKLNLRAIKNKSGGAIRIPALDDKNKIFTPYIHPDGRCFSETIFHLCHTIVVISSREGR